MRHEGRIPVKQNKAGLIPVKWKKTDLTGQAG
jgi:hypothetical protein